MDILAIDDDEVILAYIQEVLEEKGHQVFTHSDSTEGLAKAEEREFDLILLDLKMPGLDGMQVLTRLNEMGSLAPVIILTGYGSREKVQESMRRGAFDFIEKPFEIAPFTQTVEKAMIVSRAIQSLANSLFELDILGLDTSDKKHAVRKLLEAATAMDEKDAG